MTAAALTERYRTARSDDTLVVLEGLHALKHAVRFGAHVLHACTPDLAALEALAERLCPDVAADVLRHAEPMSADTFATLAPVAPNTGVLALARRPAVDLAAALADPDAAPAVLLDAPTHPGNVGAVVRVAAAAGAAGVLTRGELDPWGAAAVRGGAGLQFALPVGRVEELPAHDRPVVAVTAEGTPLLAGALPPRALLVFGSERRGLADDLRELATHTVGIPMRTGVSSLNLATAVAVALYLGPPAP